jgi:hypothetical protein
MIPGIVASQATVEIADAGGGSLPAGAVGLLDFVSGTYLFEATGEPVSYTAAEVISTPDQITFAVGLVATDAGDPSSEILAEFADYLATANWTIVIEWRRGDTFCVPLYMTDDDGYPPRIKIEDSESSAWVFAFDQKTGQERDLFRTQSGDTHALAFTRTDAKIAMSLDGSTVTQSTTPLTGVTWTKAWLGGVDTGAFWNITVGRIVIYPPQDNADLPALAVVEVLA